MLFKSLSLTALVAAVGVAGSAQAADGVQVRRSETFAVTVVLPDFTAAREAQAHRAAGLWTLFSGSRGLMVALPGGEGGGGALAIYHSDANQVAVSVVKASAEPLFGPTGLGYGRPLRVVGETAYRGLHKVTFADAAGDSGSDYLLLSGI